MEVLADFASLRLWLLQLNLWVKDLIRIYVDTLWLVLCSERVELLGIFIQPLDNLLGYEFSETVSFHPVSRGHAPDVRPIHIVGSDLGCIKLNLIQCQPSADIFTRPVRYTSRDVC